MRHAVVVAALLSTTTRTLADSRPPEPQAEPTDEHTAAEVAHAPRPGEASGRTDGGERDSLLRDIAQGVLVVPRYVIEAVFAPVRGGLWLYENYRLGARFKRLTFDDTRTYGVYPTLYVNSDYGVTLGARFVHRNLFGAGEQLTARAGFGGEFDVVADTGLTTANRFANVVLHVRGQLERRAHDPFYGIGNADDAIEVRHRDQVARVTSIVDLRARQNVIVRIAGALTDIDYAAATSEPPIDTVYDPAMLTGWPGTRNIHGELQVRWDTREVAKTLAQRGTLVDAFVGRIHPLEAGDDYWRYGGEASHFLPLGAGRSLAGRLHVEAVTGELDDVAFTLLPELGGYALLRGYPARRFRDRAAVLGTAEYFWDVSSFALASLFVDAGRVYPSLADLDLDHVRLGYGASLQLLRAGWFFAGVSVASSVDGGVFVNLVFDPVYEPPPRVRRE